MDSKNGTLIQICKLCIILTVSLALKGLSAGTGKHRVFGHLGLVFIWSCFVFCLLFLLFYVISAPVLAEAAALSDSYYYYS